MDGSENILDVHKEQISITGFLSMLSQILQKQKLYARKC